MTIHERDDTGEDLLAEVEERLDHPPRPWDPESRLDAEDAYREPRVAGIVEELEELDRGFGMFKLSVLRARDGSRYRVAWMGTLLEQRAKGLEIGDAVALAFRGRVQPRDESLPPYANYDVVHRRPRQGPVAIADGIESELEDKPEDGLPLDEAEAI